MLALESLDIGGFPDYLPEMDPLPLSAYLVSPVSAGVRPSATYLFRFSPVGASSLTVTPTPTPVVTDFLTDTFTDTAGTLLESHVGELGATWTKHPSFASGSAAIDNANRLRGNAVANDIYYSSGVPASADYDIYFDITPIGGSLSMGVMGRMSTGAVTYYLFDYEGSVSQFKLYTVVAGSVLNTTVSAQSLVNGTVYHCRLSLRGSTVTCYLNGTAIITKTDSNIAAAGRVGVFFATDSVDGVSGLRIDNLIGETSVTPGSFSPATITFDGTSASKTATFTAPSTPGMVTVGYANDGGLIDPGDSSVNVSGASYIDIGQIDLGPVPAVGPRGIRFEV